MPRNGRGKKGKKKRKKWNVRRSRGRERERPKLCPAAVAVPAKDSFRHVSMVSFSLPVVEGRIGSAGAVHILTTVALAGSLTATEIVRWVLRAE